MEVLPQRQAAVQMVGLHKMILIFSCLNTTIGVRAGVGRVGGGGRPATPKFGRLRAARENLGKAYF